MQAGRGLFVSLWVLPPSEWPYPSDFLTLTNTCSVLGTEDTGVDTALWWRTRKAQDLSRLAFKDRGILDGNAPSRLPRS